MNPVPESQQHDVAHPEWFRGPSPREHRIAAAFFIGFGVFFILLFFVLRGWWFRWVIIVLGGYSLVHGLRHWMDSRRAS